jgi:hypothetical protein
VTVLTLNSATGSRLSFWDKNDSAGVKFNPLSDPGNLFKDLGKEGRSFATSPIYM